MYPVSKLVQMELVTTHHTCRYTVVRHGRNQKKPASELVVGDILLNLDNTQKVSAREKPSEGLTQLASDERKNLAVHAG